VPEVAGLAKLDAELANTRINLAFLRAEIVTALPARFSALSTQLFLALLAHQHVRDSGTARFAPFLQFFLYLLLLFQLLKVKIFLPFPLASLLTPLAGSHLPLRT